MHSLFLKIEHIAFQFNIIVVVAAVAAVVVVDIFLIEYLMLTIDWLYTCQTGSSISIILAGG